MFHRLPLIVLALLLSASAAQAAGLSLSLTARNADEARALNAAITLYALHRDIRAGADLRQIGRNHSARVQQSGRGNLGLIRQRGQGHSADLTQTGGRNGQVILQFGTGAHADIRQHGGQAGILVQVSP